MLVFLFVLIVSSTFVAAGKKEVEAFKKEPTGESFSELSDSEKIRYWDQLPAKEQATYLDRVYW